MKSMPPGISLYGHYPAVCSSLDSHIMQFDKLYMDLQKHHALSLALCPGSMDILQFYWHVLVLEGQRMAAQREQGESFQLQGIGIRLG